MTAGPGQVSVATVPRVLPALVLAACLGQPWAAAADDDEWVIAAEPDYALHTAPGTDASHGTGGNLSAWFGVSEAAWLTVSAGAWTYLGEVAPPTVFEAVGGLVVALDVLRVIPFLEAAAGANIIDGVPTPVLRVGVGADYLVSEALSIGGVVRYRPLFDTGGDQMVTIGLRVGLRGEW